MIRYANDHIQSESSSGLGRSVFLGACLSLSCTASSSLSSSPLSDPLSLEPLSSVSVSVGGALEPAEAIMSGLYGWNWTLPIASAISPCTVCRSTPCDSALKQRHWRLWLFAKHATDVPCRNIALLTLLALGYQGQQKLTWSPVAEYLPHGSTSNQSLWFVSPFLGNVHITSVGLRTSYTCIQSDLLEAMNR
jgi:hypothetical protein